MSPTWQEIWRERRLDLSHSTVQKRLMAADGLDTAFGSLTESAWRAFVRHVAQTLGLEPGESVFEVGCGAGAFLYDLYETGCTVAGVDLSEALVGYARDAMPDGSFEVADAAEMAASRTYDFVVSCGVFLYFPSLPYAREVIRRMATHAVKGIAILDVPDRALEEKALAARRAALGESAYDERYRGLSHLYYDREWLTRALQDEGATKLVVEDQNIPGYGNSAFRFNVFAWFTG